MCAGRPRGPDTEDAFVHVDPLGTPLAVTGSPAVPADAVAIWRARYDPFGSAAVDEDPDGDGVPFSLRVRFPGQLEDGETGLHYNFYRTYDPMTGRYLGADPIGQLGGLNLSAYAENDPLQWSDPWGLILMICDLHAKNLIGNYSYLLNPDGGRNAGRGGSCFLRAGVFRRVQVEPLRRCRLGLSADARGQR